MKLRALVNGDVIDADEDAAKQLVGAGIYAAYDEKDDKKDAEKEDKDEKKERAPVTPLTTEDLPPKTKRVK